MAHIWCIVCATDTKKERNHHMPRANNPWPTETRTHRINMAFPPSFIRYLDGLRNKFNSRSDIMRPVSRTDIIMFAVRQLRGEENDK